MPNPQEITTSKGANSITVTYDFGENLAEAVQLFGEEVVFTGFRHNATIALQGLVRPELDKGTDPEAIKQKAAAWKPGVVTRSASDPISAIVGKWATMTDEQRKALMQKLKAAQ